MLREAHYKADTLSAASIQVQSLYAPLFVLIP